MYDPGSIADVFLAQVDAISPKCYKEIATRRSESRLINIIHIERPPPYVGYLLVWFIDGEASWGTDLDLGDTVFQEKAHENDGTAKKDFEQEVQLFATRALGYIRNELEIRCHNDGKVYCHAINAPDLKCKEFENSFFSTRIDAEERVARALDEEGPQHVSFTWSTDDSSELEKNHALASTWFSRRYERTPRPTNGA